MRVAREAEWLLAPLTAQHSAGPLGRVRPTRRAPTTNDELALALAPDAGCARRQSSCGARSASPQIDKLELQAQAQKPAGWWSSKRRAARTRPPTHARMELGAWRLEIRSKARRVAPHSTNPLRPNL